MDKEISNKKKKRTYLLRIGMMILTLVLIVLFVLMMALVSRIQGTGRVVNYAGLVRGKTQRIIKLEDAGKPQDQMLQDVQDYIDGLRGGSDKLQLVRLEDKKFQSKMKELDDYFQQLKKEILIVREKGYEHTQIVEKSEEFFKICDEATGFAEVYSDKRTSTLDVLEKIVILDICGLVLLLGLEVLKMLRYAAQNRLLQKKIYLDEATGLPNKNKCEEILENNKELEAGAQIAVCVFDLNNLRMINNNLGHDKGEAYIRSFAGQLRAAMPEDAFVGRDGGDEFLAVLTGKNHTEVQECLAGVRKSVKLYSQQHPEMPISYAAGYALSDDYEPCTMRMLFKQADKNMYVDKNHAKVQENERKRKESLQLLDRIREKHYVFANCLYCDARMDTYRMLRSEEGFFLAEDGSYTGAAEQVLREFAADDTRKKMRKWLEIASMEQSLGPAMEKTEFSYQRKVGAGYRYGRMTALFVNDAADGRLHHFILGFDEFHDSEKMGTDEKFQLTRYYEQMKQSILENGNYVEALMETAQAIYTVDLTNDCLKSIFYHTGRHEFAVDAKTPCSYDLYCQERQQYVAEETLENYRIVDSSSKLLERYLNGEKQVTVEYQERNHTGKYVWMQKTVLMSLDTLFDSKTGKRSTVIQGMILFKNTSLFHAKEQQERERLQVAYETADSENKAKTEFMNRMSHDIRTPINGIAGMIDIIQKNRDDKEKLDDCLRKLRLSTDHLQALVNDVLEVNKISSGKMKLGKEPFNLEELMDEVSALLDIQIKENGITHEKHRIDLRHVKLIGSPLHLRQILINLLSNSIKYNKENGHIDTYVQEVKYNATHALYEFKIVDTGIGMSKEFIANQIYKPFTQEKTDARTQYKGTGLGMSIVRGLIDKMHGSIKVKSVLGEGSVFIVQIPFELDTAEYETDISEKEKTDKSLKGLHVLLVEDNDINMEVAQFYLEDAGATVEKAWNGQEAVDMVSKNCNYDVILMDLMMPVMDGMEAARRIRKLETDHAKNVPILAMTAQSASDSEQMCKDAGMNGYVAKPVAAKLLTIEIRKAMQC